MQDIEWLLPFGLKIEPRPEEQSPSHSSFSDGIICGLHRGSFAVRDHLRSNLGIISGLGIICGRGSFTALYSTYSYRSTTYLLPPSSTLWRMFCIHFTAEEPWALKRIRIPSDRRTRLEYSFEEIVIVIIIIIIIIIISTRHSMIGMLTIVSLRRKRTSLMLYLNG